MMMNKSCAENSFCCPYLLLSWLVEFMTHPPTKSNREERGLDGCCFHFHGMAMVVYTHTFISIICDSNLPHVQQLKSHIFHDTQP